MTPAVAMKEVVKRVRDGRHRRTVLDGIDLELSRGELAVLRGPSGSGKTTLLGLLGCMLSPTSGEVFLDGEATSRLREHHRAEVRRRKVGFVFQELHLLEDMPVLENVLVPRVPDGATAEDQRRALALLERFGVASLAATRARALSGGERQRVALARALIADPPVLLLDEPTAHVDDARAAVILDELVTLAEQGRAVLVATHDGRIAGDPRVHRVLDLSAGKLMTPALPS